MVGVGHDGRKAARALTRLPPLPVAVQAHSRLLSPPIHTHNSALQLSALDDVLHRERGLLAATAARRALLGFSVARGGGLRHVHGGGDGAARGSSARRAVVGCRVGGM